jgi:hypothetical protein
MLILLAAVWCGVWTGVTDAAEPPEPLDQYAWRASLGGGHETGKLYRARLTEDLYDGFQSFPLDLLVADRDGVEWPAMVWAVVDTTRIDPVRATQRHRIEVEQSSAFTVKEFRIEPDPRTGEIPPHNRVIVQLGGGPHVRRAEVWGGEEVERLVLLGSGMLIEQKAPYAIRQRAVDYPETVLPLVVVRVYGDAGDSDAEVVWRSTEIVRRVADEGYGETFAVRIIEPPEGEPPGVPGTHRVYLDTGSRNRPLLALVFDVALERAALPVRVFGRNEVTNTWRWVADGGLHDMEGHVQREIALPRAGYRFLRVDLMHPPEREVPRIRSVEATAQPHDLVYRAETAGRAHAYFGSPRYGLPAGSFARGLDQQAWHRAEESEPGRRQSNPSRVAKSLEDYGSTLMVTGASVIALLVAIFTVRFIRQRWG